MDIEITHRPGKIQLSLLSTYASRIRSLNISSHAVRSHLLNYFSDTPAPLMQNLRIVHDPFPIMGSRLSSMFFTGNLPSLRTLVLSDISSDLTNLVLPNLTTCGLLVHLSFPPGVVVDLSVYIRGSDFDAVARIIPFHHDLIPCTKSIREVRLQCLFNGCHAAFSGGNDSFTIYVAWQGMYSFGPARAMCSFEPLDVSEVETRLLDQ